MKFLLASILALVPMVQEDYCYPPLNVPMPEVPCIEGGPLLPFCLGACYQEYVDAYRFAYEEACDAQQAAEKNYEACKMHAANKLSLCLTLATTPEAMEMCYEEYRFDMSGCRNLFLWDMGQIDLQFFQDISDALSTFNDCAEWCCDNA